MAKEAAVEGTTVKVEGNRLIINLPLNDPPKTSGSGKSLIVAGTGGFLGTSAVVNGKPVSISVNATIPVR